MFDREYLRSHLLLRLGFQYLVLHYFSLRIVREWNMQFRSGGTRTRVKFLGEKPDEDVGADEQTLIKTPLSQARPKRLRPIDRDFLRSHR